LSSVSWPYLWPTLSSFVTKLEHDQKARSSSPSSHEVSEQLVSEQ
jgi:hypothetical protein